MSAIRQSAAKSLVWTLVESGGLSGVSLLVLIAFSWLLSPAEMGIGSIALGIVQLLMVPVEILFQDALIQRTDVEEAHFDTAFTATLILALVILLAAWTCSGLLGWFVSVPEVAPVFSFMSLSLLPMAFGSIIAARQRRNLDFRSLALRSLGGRLGSAVVGVGIALYGGGVWALVAQQLTLWTFASAVLWWLADHRPRLRFSRKHFHELIGFGIRSVFVMSANVAIPRVYMLLVGAWLGAASAGYINIAFRAVDMLRDVVAGAVSQLALPVFGRFKNDRGAFQRSYTEAMSFTCLVGFPMFTGLGVCAPEMVTIVFGPQWQPSIPYVSLFGFLVIPYFMRLYVMPCMAASGCPEAALPGSLASLLFIVVGMATIGRLSLATAAFVWGARLLVSFPIDTVLLRKVSGINLRTQIQGVGYPLLASLVMLAAVTAERAFVLEGIPLIVRITAVILLGVTFYGGLILMLDQPTVMRLLDFARSAISRSGRPADQGVVPSP